MVRAISAVLVLAASGCGHVSSIADDASADSDADSDTDMVTCTAGGKWHDEATGLCWQNPSSSQSDGPFDWYGAVAQCQNLSSGGFEDWRLPMIQELISLLRGCVNEIATGDLGKSECGITDPECLEECFDSSCGYCEDLEGPDDDPSGCYWVPELEAENCYTYWSSSNADGASSAWFVPFTTGAVNRVEKETPFFLVRCVRP